MQFHISVCTSAGPMIHIVLEGESIALRCAANETPNVTVTFNLRGRERAHDNYTLELSQIGSSYWEVQGNASSCQPIALNVQGLDSGDYRNFTCMYTNCNVEDNGQLDVTIVLVVVVLVVVVLVVLLFTFSVGKLYRERKKRLLDPPGKIFKSSTFLFSLISTITLADCVYKDD